MVDNVFEFRRNDRTLWGSNVYTWAILDDGLRLNEALYDYDKLMTVMKHQAERYHFDIYMDVQNRNPQRATTLLGGGWTRIDDDKQSVLVLDHQVLHDDEYDDFTKNPTEYFYTHALKRYCKEGITMGEIKVAIREYADFWKHVEERKAMLRDEYGSMQFFRYFVKSPYEDYWQDHRGMRATALDIRRHPDKLKEVLDCYFETQTKPALAVGMQTTDYTGYVSPMNTAMLACNYLNIKQFEKFYWPYFKEILDACIEHKQRIFFFVEGVMIRFADYLSYIPKGNAMLCLEQDDLREVRKALPNIALCGGMPSVMLGSGTPEECVDYAKNLIDDLGDGFILCQDKMLSYKNDAQRETLQAVSDFVLNYKTETMRRYREWIIRILPINCFVRLIFPIRKASGLF